MMAGAWTFLLTADDPVVVASVLGVGVVLAIILTWPWGWDE